MADALIEAKWNWPDESGHIWEAQSPHLPYANKCLKINTLDKEVSQASIKSAFSKPLQIKGSRRKMRSYKFPNVSTVMWPSPAKYCKEFIALTVSVDKALAYFATHPDTVLGLFGRYGEESGLELAQAAEISKSKAEHL